MLFVTGTGLTLVGFAAPTATPEPTLPPNPSYAAVDAAACEALLAAATPDPPSPDEIEAKMESLERLRPSLTKEQPSHEATTLAETLEGRARLTRIRSTAARHWPIVGDGDLRLLLRKVADHNMAEQDGVALTSLCDTIVND